MYPVVALPGRETVIVSPTFIGMVDPFWSMPKKGGCSSWAGGWVWVGSVVLFSWVQTPVAVCWQCSHTTQSTRVSHNKIMYVFIFLRINFKKNLKTRKDGEKT
jgi:hypothetical protein